MNEVSFKSRTWSLLYFQNLKIQSNYSKVVKVFGKEMATLSSVLAGKSNRQGDLAAWSSESHRVGQDWATEHAYMHAYSKK